jgi:septal ring factor EnvC (AmiA/AmiB activator)
MLRAFCVCVIFGAGQLSEEVRAKEKRETQVLEELAGLRDSLRAEEQARFEVSEERERLTKQLGDLDAALQVLNLHLLKLS